MTVPANRLDDLMAETIRSQADGMVTTQQIRGAILAAGYSPGGLRFLVGASPVLRRVRPGVYRLREA